MIGTPGGSAERPALFFRTPAEFRRWLLANHETATELWMGLHKKHVADGGLTWKQAVPEALCFGWIESVAQRTDADSVRQRWTPRKAGSTWSNVNTELVGRLTAEGRMKPTGLAAFERRRADRQGIYSHEFTGQVAFTPAHEALLRANPTAAAWYDAAPASYRKVVTRWVATAKRESTRDSRMAELVDDCASGRLIKTQRYGEQPSWVARNRVALGID
ncbi:MAG: YdeI/OmpD-associated family protein [Nakamurella sp.]